jgi:hypothetical protein
MPRLFLRHGSQACQPRPNSEFLADLCTNHVETWTIKKGSKCCARQLQKSNLGHGSKHAREDRIANFYKTAAPIILKPFPLERARNAVLGNHKSVIWDMGPSMPGEDRIANFYKTAAPIVLRPGPLERAQNVVLGNHKKLYETWVQACQPRTE